jgi:hypothetical protein
MIEAEEKVINDIPNKSLEKLVQLFHAAHMQILDNSERVELILSDAIRFRGYGEEVMFSTFRLIKAVVAELEYRIKEKII